MSLGKYVGEREERESETTTRAYIVDTAPGEHSIYMQVRVYYKGYSSGGASFIYAVIARVYYKEYSSGGAYFIYIVTARVVKTPHRIGL